MMIYIQPNTQSVQINQPFHVAVQVDYSQTWNAAQAQVGLSNLALDSVQPGDCGLTFLNTADFPTPSFVGASLGTYVSRPCTIETLTVHGVKRGQATVTLTSARVISNVDQSDLLTAVHDGTYSITRQQILKALRK